MYGTYPNLDKSIHGSDVKQMIGNVIKAKIGNAIQHEHFDKIQSIEPGNRFSVNAHSNTLK